MKRPLLISFGLFAIVAFTYAGSGPVHDASRMSIVYDSLPLVLGNNRADLLNQQLRQEAALRYEENQLPSNRNEWNTYSKNLRDEIIKKAAVIIDHQLPFNLRETGSIKMNGYTVKNIAFQTRPGVYATANLYVPEGSGKCPGVIVMMGHSAEGRFYDKYQSVGITLALNGYVSLCIDPWGSGERTTTHGVFEDHGDENNLGAQLMNVGETLMGMLLTDNIRGVDLLCSL